MLQMESGKMSPGAQFVAGDLSDDVYRRPDESMQLNELCCWMAAKRRLNDPLQLYSSRRPNGLSTVSSVCAFRGWRWGV